MVYSDDFKRLVLNSSFGSGSVEKMLLKGDEFLGFIFKSAASKFDVTPKEIVEAFDEEDESKRKAIYVKAQKCIEAEKLFDKWKAEVSLYEFNEKLEAIRRKK